jgi:transposase
VIVDHDSGRLIWAAPGRDKKTLNTFFDTLGKSRSAKLKEGSSDGAD